MGWVWPCGWFCRGEFGGVQCFRHSYLKTYTYIKTTCCLDRRAHIVFPTNLRLKPDWTGVLEIKWRNAQIHSHISNSQKRTSMGHHVVYGSGGNHLYRMAGNTVYSHDMWVPVAVRLVAYTAIPGFYVQLMLTTTAITSSKWLTTLFR